MSRKYNVSKKKNKGVVGGVVAVLATALLVGGLGALTKGFKDWTFDFKDSETETPDERFNLKVIDVRTDVSGSLFNSSSIISFLNEGLGEESDPIFKDVAFIEHELTRTDEETGEKIPYVEKEYMLTNVYKDNGGMKFGTSSGLGSFTINLVENYTFTHVKIVGRNYSAFNNSKNEWSCDESSIIVNGAEAQVFGTNFDDKMKSAPTEEKVFAFQDTQNQLSISVLGRRATIFTIELWTELA